MKAVFFLLAVVGLSHGASIAQPSHSRALMDDFKDFADLIPFDTILDIIVGNLGDSELQDVIVYIFSEDFKQLVVDIEAIPEYKPVADYLEGAGVPFKEFVDALHEFLGIPKVYNRNVHRGLKDIVDQIMAIIPFDDIEEMYYDKEQNSPAFKELVGKVHSPEFVGLVKAIANNKEVKRLGQELRGMGLDIDGVIEYLLDFFGFTRFTRNTRALMDDFKDFADLIPADDILAIVIANLGDPEVQEVIVYIFSEEFKQLVLDIEAIPQYKPVVDYLEGAGVPIKEFVKALHDFLGISRSYTRSNQRGLREVVDQIKAIIPFDELEKMFNDKAQNSPAFKELLGKIHSTEFVGFVKAIASNTEVKRIGQELRKKGLDIDGMIEFVKDFLGFTRYTRSTRALMDDFKDFADLIPADDILAIVIANLGDPEVQEVIVYIFSEEFKQLVLDIEAIPQYKPVVDYLEGAGVPIKEFVKALHDFLGISRSYTRSNQRGLREVVDQIKAIIPFDELEKMFNDKAQNSPAFKELLGKIHSTEFVGFVKAIASNTEVKRIGQELRKKGLDIDGMIEFVKDFLGFTRYTRSTRALMDDFKDFADLIPADDILAIVIANLGDPEVQEVIVYIFSEEFKQLVLDIEAIPQYKPVVDYLEGAGVPIKEFVKALHDFLGISRSYTRSNQRGLREVVDQIKAIIPFDELEKMFNDKAQNSPAFKELLGKIHSTEFVGFVKAIASNTEVKRIGQELRKKGLDIDGMIEFVKDFLGFTRYTRSTRALMDDFKDFADLIPADDILAIVIANLGDPEVQEVIVYIFSEEFKQLVLDIEAIPQYKPVVDYLEGAGVPIKEFVKALHDFLGISRSYTRSNQRGLREVVDQIKAIIPFDELEKMFNDKAQNSPAFKELLGKIHSTEFVGFVKAIASNTEVKRIGQELRKKGLDIDGMIEFVKDFLGFTRYTRNTRALMDDLKDFVDLLPSDEILAIVISALGDPEVQEVIVYIFSDEFAKLVVEVEAIPEFNAVVDYLESAGLPVRAFIEALHDFLGISYFQRSNIQRGLKDVIDQIIAVLPLDDIQALYEYKLKNSAAFKELVDKMHSSEFTKLVKAIASNAEVKRIANELRSKGLDIDGFIELIKTIFGFN